MAYVEIFLQLSKKGFNPLNFSLEWKRMMLANLLRRVRGWFWGTKR